MTMVALLARVAFFSLFAPQVWSLPSTRTHITHLVVFGDSFSDNGTGAWEVSKNTWPVDPAYYHHEFSNGPVWVQDLASSFHWTLSDYAVGGATSNNTLVQGYTGPNSTIPVPSTLDQVQEYLKTRPTHSDISSTLFVIFIGANDVFFEPQLNASDSVHSIRSVVSQLRGKGASNFLVPTLPDFGTIPYDNYISINDSNVLHNFSASFRSQVLTMAHASTEYTLTVVDAYLLFDDFFARPKAYGFDPNVTHSSCLTGAYGEAPRKLCSNPDQYVFWDEYHPTRKSHEYLAELAKQQLSPLYG